MREIAVYGEYNNQIEIIYYCDFCNQKTDFFPDEIKIGKKYELCKNCYNQVSNSIDEIIKKAGD